METKGNIELRISGKKGHLNLTPETTDIKDIIDVLTQIDQLLFQSSKKDRPIISYQIGEGSVRHVFSTSMQHIVAFNAVIGQIIECQEIDFLDNPMASAIEAFQVLALKKDWLIEMSTNLANSNTLRIDRTTGLQRKAAEWVESEFYFYGKVMNLGGKTRSNLHLNTEEYGNIILNSTQEYLSNIPDNIVYKYFGVRAIGRQMLTTGEIDKDTLSLLEILDYQPTYNEEYLSVLQKKATDSWLGSIDTDAWLKNLRNGHGV